MQRAVITSYRLVIVTHELFYGAAHALRDYLAGIKGKDMVFISHPIMPENPRSYIQVFWRGTIVRENKVTRPSGGIVWYAVDSMLTVFWVIKEMNKYDLFVGVDPLNCLIGLFLRTFGLVHRVIFYSIDFVPRRFDSRLLNSIYHGIEWVCVRFADECWDVSPRIARGRHTVLGISPTGYPARIVPIGVWKKDIVRSVSYDAHQFSFVGHLLPKQGVDTVLEALPAVIKRVPGASFLVIGGGEDEARLRCLADTLGIARHVTFTGWIHDQVNLRRRLARCAFAVAPYDPQGRDTGNFTYYADPTKIKTYLACGLPVVMTDVPYNAKKLEKDGCAMVVPYTKRAIAAALARWLTDRHALTSARRNAVRLARRYTWEEIFAEAVA
jgi:glycosyltransferase involved in cell wall biosynthesis